MSKRTLIGATYREDIPNKHKILAADGVMGAIILLAYWGGGTNLFPEGVLPEFFVDDHPSKTHGIVKLDVEGLTDLIGELSKAAGREIGQLSIGSLPVYLSALRKGRRANGNGEIIPAQVQYYKNDKVLYIHPRNYAKDLEAGLLGLMPDGLI